MPKSTDLTITIEPAGPADVPAIRALYNREIRDGVAVWNTAERSADQMTVWFEGRVGNGFPVLVARGADGALAGYGTFGPFRSSDGYAQTVEHSLYVAAHAQRRGVGRALLTALEHVARAQGRRVMVGGADSRNAASIALHRRCGFVETARLPEVGRKFDQWLTLVLMQKVLGDSDAA